MIQENPTGFCQMKSKMENKLRGVRDKKGRAARLGLPGDKAGFTAC